jgi:cold shock CspA family protein
MPQGTVKDFDQDARMGSLLTEDKAEVFVDATSMEGSGIRSLRIGQRVRFDLVEEGGRKMARTLTIVTF